ncbi:MAG: hypothetical protein R3E96_10895 [Planctomycetota bacterium]
MDAKKRVFVPKRLAMGLPLDSEGQRGGVLTPGTDGCLYLFPESGFTRAIGRLNTQAYAPPQKRALQRKLFKDAHRVSLDGSSRLLLPAALIAQAGIDKEAVFVGIMDRIEIWSPEGWAAEQARLDAETETIDRLLAGDVAGGGGI